MLMTREQSNAIVNILPRAYYRKFLPRLTKIFRTSRNRYLRRFDMWVNVSQVGIINNLSKFQDAITHANRVLRNGELALEEKQRILDGRFMNRQLARVLQSIADGIAWRCLNYKRPVLRLLSEHVSTGHIGEDEKKFYIRLLQRSRTRTIINDITHFLRIADFTQIDSSGRVMLYESKKDSESIRDIGWILDQLILHRRLPTAQEYGHFVAQFPFIDNAIRIPTFSSGRVTEEEYQIIDSDIPIPTHHKKLREMIRRANKRGYCVECVEPGYLIEVIAYDRMSETRDIDKRFAEYKIAYERVRDECLGGNKSRRISISSWDSFIEEGGHFPRNITPHSVLPFSDRDCVRLMMGYLRIKTIINVDTLADIIKRDGWEVEFVDKLTKQPRIKPEEYEPFSSYRNESTEDFLMLSRSIDGHEYQISLPFTFVIVMMTSYYQFRFLADEALSHFRNPNRRPSFPNSRKIVVNFTNEHRVLN